MKCCPDSIYLRMLKSGSMDSLYYFFYSIGIDTENFDIASNNLFFGENEKMRVFLIPSNEHIDAVFVLSDLDRKVLESKIKDYFG